METDEIYAPQFGTNLEHAIVRALVAELHKAGFVPVRVWNEGEYVKVKDMRSILDAVFSVSAPTLHFAPAADPKGWGRLGVLLVIGNERDIISDYHAGNAEFCAAIERVSDAAESGHITLTTGGSHA